jgi:plastocyanin
MQLGPALLVVSVLLLQSCDEPSNEHPGAQAHALATHEALRSDCARAPVAPGTISGLVHYTGGPAARTPINTQAQGGCGMDPNEPPLTETLVVDQARLANVFVWLENPPPEALLAPLPEETAVLRQRGCIYRPHALGLRVGQKLQVTNEDGATHNVRATPRRDLAAGFNRTQAAGAAPLEVEFNAPEVAIAIVCDLHPWMRAWVGVFEHPYFAVSDAQGRFAWSGLPEGRYQVRAWHEKLGRLSGEALLSAEHGAALCLSFAEKP